MWAACRAGDEQEVLELMHEAGGEAERAALANSMHCLDGGYQQPMCFAAGLNGHESVLRLLHDAGADLAGSDSEGQSLEAVLERHGRPDMMTTVAAVRGTPRRPLAKSEGKRREKVKKENLSAEVGQHERGRLMGVLHMALAEQTELQAESARLGLRLAAVQSEALAALAQLSLLDRLATQ